MKKVVAVFIPRLQLATPSQRTESACARRRKRGERGWVWSYGGTMSSQLSVYAPPKSGSTFLSQLLAALAEATHMCHVRSTRFRCAHRVSVACALLIPEPKRLSPDAWDADPQSRAFDFRVNFYLDYSSFRTYGPLYPVP